MTPRQNPKPADETEQTLQLSRYDGPVENGSRPSYQQQPSPQQRAPQQSRQDEQSAYQRQPGYEERPEYGYPNRERYGHGGEQPGQGHGQQPQYGENAAYQQQQQQQHQQHQHWQQSQEQSPYQGRQPAHHEHGGGPRASRPGQTTGPGDSGGYAPGPAHPGQPGHAGAHQPYGGPAPYAQAAAPYTQPAAQPSRGSGDLAISISGLHKTYGDVQAVKNLDLVIAPGEVVALLGPNGAGKSTTIDMVLGLARPTSGKITIFGKVPYVAVREGLISAVLQEGSLIDDLSVRETLSMISSLYKSPLPLDEVMRRAQIEDFVDRQGTKLSGGQRQRARYACALIGNPSVLILDEPTSAMDVGARRSFWDSMRQFTDTGRTVVFATHYLDEAEEFADRVVLMRSGRIAADGTVAEVRALAAGRVLRAAVPDATLQGLLALPGVNSGTLRQGQAELQCSDSDTTVRALLTQFPRTHDIEISAAGLEEAFLSITQDPAEEDHSA